MSKVLGGASDIGRIGHGLGMQLTEWPSIAAHDHTELKAGMVITLEPSLMIDEARMMVVEENILITEGAPEMLTTRISRDFGGDLMAQVFETDAGYGDALGLIVLSTDETMEPELASVFGPAKAAVYHSRIHFEEQVTPETLAKMQLDLPASAGMLSQNVKFGCIGYGCTSGATVIGPDKITSLVNGVHAGCSRDQSDFCRCCGLSCAECEKDRVSDTLRGRCVRDDARIVGK